MRVQRPTRSISAWLAEVLGAAGDVHRYRFVLRDELQAIEQVTADEFHRVVDLQPRIVQTLDQAQGAGTGVAVDRVEAAAAGLEQGGEQLVALVVGLLRIPLGRERLAAAEVVQVIREHHLVAGLFQ